MGKMLPDVYGMRMLTTCPASPFKESEVGVFGASQPWMSIENTTPMLPKSCADGDWIANRILCKDPGRTSGVLG